jgi:hypothetical protein
LGTSLFFEKKTSSKKMNLFIEIEAN